MIPEADRKARVAGHQAGVSLPSPVFAARFLKQFLGVANIQVILVMHAHFWLLLDLLQLFSHALTDHRAPHGIRPVSILPADMAHSVECSRRRRFIS
jgi:hypothetical protein